MPKDLIKAFKWIDKKFNSHPLTKNDKLSAYYRYILFNVIQRFFPKERVYSLLSNTKFHARVGLSGIVPNIYFGLYEFEEMSFLLHYLKRDETFLDVGANVGYYTLLASAEKKCKSISIEPIPFSFKQLSKNIDLNNLKDKVVLHNIGLSNNNGYLFFTNFKGSMNHVTEENSKYSVKVEVKKVDDIINETVHYLKIDAEGYEKFILEGATELLKNLDLNVIQIELNSSGKKFGIEDKDIDSFLRNFSFKPYRYLPFERKIEKLNSFRTDQYNTLYIKNINEARTRVRHAKPIKIFKFSY